MKQSIGIANSFESEFGDAFAGRRVLVTGATGFIGWHLCKALVELGAKVYGLSRTASAHNLPKGSRPKSVDLADYKTVKIALGEFQPELIYHLAGMVTASQDIALVLPMLRNNLTSTVHLLHAASDTGCSGFVSVGSSEEAYEGSCHKIPSSPYAAAKKAGSIYAKMFQQLYGVPVVIMHPFTVYGPRQETSKLIPYTILSLLRGEPPKIASGSRVCDFIYVLDVVRGLVKAGICSRILEGDTIELGTSHGCQIKEVVELLLELTNSKLEPIFGVMPDRVGESSKVANVKKTDRLLGWKPLWSLRDGLYETVRWYRNNCIKDRGDYGTS